MPTICICPPYPQESTEVDNKHLIVASCWFSLSSHFNISVEGGDELMTVER